jgi:hypothetical protein
MVHSVLGHARAVLGQFIASIEPFGSAYANPEFSFLVRHEEDGPKLVACQLTLQPLTIKQPDIEVEVGRFYGCRVSLKSLGLTPQSVIERLLEAKISSPSRSIAIARGDPHQPFLVTPYPPDERFLNQKISRLHGLNLGMKSRSDPNDDWVLRASATPYGNVVDLKVSLGLSADSSNQFEVVAYPPILIDATSRISGETAKLGVRCIRTLSKDQVGLGYIVRDPAGNVTRGSISGRDLNWETSADSSEIMIGTGQLQVPKASVIQCLAVYGTECLHAYIVGDPDAHQNPLRNIVEIFDPRLETIQELLASNDKGRHLSHEAAVAAVLWSLGFAPLHFDPLNTDAPDIIGVSHDGNLVIVECTLGDIKTKRSNKLQKLMDRTADVRSALDRSNASHRGCIPILITARKRTEIQGDIEECERRGVIVFTQEDIEPLLSQSLWLPASDVRFKELLGRHNSLLEAANLPKT